jgi:hypothetical protein
VVFVESGRMISSRKEIVSKAISDNVEHSRPQLFPSNKHFQETLHPRI